MTYLLPFRFLLPGMALLLLLGGCCANNVCDCNDAQEDQIKLVFSPAFTPADLDTVFVQRYPLTIKSDTKPETVTIIRPATRVYDPIELNNATPFAPVGSVRLNNYRYVVRYAATPRQRRTSIALVIDNVGLKGSFDGNGCCTCYHNLSKTVTFRRDSATAQIADSTRNLRERATPVLIIRK